MSQPFLHGMRAQPNSTTQESGLGMLFSHCITPFPGPWGEAALKRCKFFSVPCGSDLSVRRMSNGEGAEVGLKDHQVKDSDSSPCDGLCSK